MSEQQSKIRAVNQSLGDAPGIGPLASNQLIYWFLLVGIAWFVGSLLGMGNLEVVFLMLWLLIAWTILGGTKPWKYLSKYVKVPYWACGYLRYKPLLGSNYGSQN